MSRNPFLDPPANTAYAQPSHDQATSKLADDIFKDLSVLDRSVSNGAAPRQPAPARTGPAPPRPIRDEDRRQMRPPPGKAERNLFDSPDKSRPRRNSESSILDKEKHDEDRRRRERRRERERREREGKSSKSKDGKSTKLRRPHGLDVIDKLDVTGIYGQGLFHHDGPFDACNPHRNRKHNNHAPMTAFAKDSANNALSGGAPKSFDYDKFHGRGEEGFAEFASSGQAYTTAPQSRKPEPTLVNPTDRVEQIHGQASQGLGTSTFLEGAPVSRSAMQRRESEREDVPTQSQGNMGGLGRKKSLAMRIRGLSQPRRPGEMGSGRVTSPDAYDPRSPESPSATLSAGGPLRARPRKDEKNPFFQNDYDDAYDRKGVQIREVEANVGRPRAGSSPRGAGLTRSLTADSGAPYGDGAVEEKPASGGFLSRMRSIKGGKRARPERRVS